MTQDFTSVTEISGDDVTTEQVERIAHRYVWAGQYCQDLDVLEIACGAGQGLGYLLSVSKSLRAGDIDPELVKQAKAHYRERVSIEVMDALDLPFEYNSLDVVLLFEAIYYLPDVEKFITECKRVLRPGGRLLIVSANKDLYDFNPSPFSHTYYGVVELAELLERHGLSADLSGFWPQTKATIKQRILRPVKKIVVSLGLMPKSMAGKKLLKRLVFGSLVPMPAEIDQTMIEYIDPSALDPKVADRLHKVIYCAAQL